MLNDETSVADMIDTVWVHVPVNSVNVKAKLTAVVELSTCKPDLTQFGYMYL